MPMYVYRCPTCSEEFELRRSFDEYDQPATCPQGHEGAERIITTWGTGGAIRSGKPTRVAKTPSTSGTAAGSAGAEAPAAEPKNP